MWICAHYACFIMAAMLVCLFCSIENLAIDRAVSVHAGLACIRTPAKVALFMMAVLLYWALTNGLFYVSMLNGIDPKRLDFAGFVRAWSSILIR